ncbi:uncharacterized protein B0T23DRAFT_327553 [Neurospora hispaniola]|uniref:Zn(2)-C6 fungal-type domain-containing protein n=1 Tax=Neurospora hispaniola TaxID=588809 RepID=A0AAJ0MLL7_9PEZI|nr:hypothetical protein B0T23DRAFT_327553 [Neurospora hispaniola]
MTVPMEGIESTPASDPAPAPAPAAAQQSDHSGGPLPPIHTLPMPPAPATNNSNNNNNNSSNRPLTPPVQAVAAAAAPPPPPPQLPPITAFPPYQDQYQQSPHQHSSPWQPIHVPGLTPPSQTSYQPSPSSALTPSPTAVNPTPQQQHQQQQITLPGPASLLNTHHTNAYLSVVAASTQPPSIAIPSITTIPSHAARQERARQDQPNRQGQGQPKRRNRPAVSCIPCRGRKIKCDKQKPCESCVKSKYIKGPCRYDKSRLPKEKRWPGEADSRIPSPEPQQRQQQQPSIQPVDPNIGGAPYAVVKAEERTSMPGPPPTVDIPYRDSESVSSDGYDGGSASPRLPPVSSASSPFPRHAHPVSDAEGTEALRREVWMLRQQVEELTHRQQNQEQQQLPPGQRPLPEFRPNSQAGDNRWPINQLFPLVTSASYKVFKEPNDNGKALTNLRTCTLLSQKIEEAQSGSIHPLGFSDIGGILPLSYRQDAQRLAEAYFRTFESVYRILHVPTFWTRFGEYFGGQLDGQLAKAFLVQLQLCMAIGSVFEDAGGSLRKYQERWIQEGQSWLLLCPPTNLAGLQTMCLLHLAKEVCGFGGSGGEGIYNSAGSLLRKAMCLGLNRDPDASMPIYQAELCRRLWATILEMLVQSSLDTGLPPGISLTEFDTSPPANYDDEQLAPSSSGPRPSGTFTQTTILVELHRSFPVRLAIAQHLATLLNSPNTKPPAVESGPTTKSLSTELISASRALAGTLQPGYDPAGILPNRISAFQLRMAEMLVDRFFLGLNLALVKRLEVEMPEIRTYCGAAAGTIWRGVVSGLGNQRETGGSCGKGAAQRHQMDDFTTLVSRGSGTSYHATATVAVLTLLVELRRQMEEEWEQRGLRHDSTSTASPSNKNNNWEEQSTSAEATRQEFLDLACSAVGWIFGRIQLASVDTGAYVWMYLLYSAALEEVKALQRRWVAHLRQQDLSSTSLTDANVERQREEQLKELVKERIASDLNRVAELLKEVWQFSKEVNGTGNDNGSESNGGLAGRQSNGDTAALAGRAAGETSLELEKMAERGERPVIRFNSVFDLRNYKLVYMQELMD